MALRICKDIFGMCKRRVDANIRRRTAIGQFEKKIGRLFIGRLQHRAGRLSEDSRQLQ
jgi:hypothetical protein